MHDDHLGRKTKNSLPPYSKLCEIPGSIAKARASEQMGTQTYSYLVQCELIFLFLLTLAWRTRLICACRIAGPDVPNLFKADVDSRWLALPQWVQDQVALNPEAKFAAISLCSMRTAREGRAKRFLAVPDCPPPRGVSVIPSRAVGARRGPGYSLLEQVGTPFQFRWIEPTDPRHGSAPLWLASSRSQSFPRGIRAGMDCTVASRLSGIEPRTSQPRCVRHNSAVCRISAQADVVLLHRRNHWHAMLLHRRTNDQR